MRTYYIHGKLTSDHLHLTATLCDESPKGYTFLSIQSSNSICNAILCFLKNNNIEPSILFNCPINKPPESQSL